ncbi:ABC transporter substrate-binding protein [Oceanicola sp. 502str15]|uniref:ABC transporter substrate-binding protein n=1 Tax=Oceanicola sp. 502str15 TaxID=2696061 RepID=UPI0020954D89|nr:ABC transporter substrate-binding protein [Oceanicola sp. 502str15]MCO6385303.1 ABC transporter substrate-binding protein [Oceanicola sp. 502str15]
MKLVSPKRRLSRLLVTLALALCGQQALAQVSDDVVKIGFLSDLSGGASALSGESTAEAVRMAIEDMGGEVLGAPVELLVADQLNKPDVGLAIAREWFDTEQVDLLLDVNSSAVALAVNDLAQERNRVFVTGSSAAELVGERCAITTTEWIADTKTLSRSIAAPLVAEGFDNWFFITIDYAFGHALEEEASKSIEAGGASIVGSVSHSPQTTDFSSFLLEAQARGAQTLALATFGTHTTNIIKQAREFGLDVKIVPFFLSLVDIKAIGQENLADTYSSTSFYWNRNEASRAWAARFQERWERAPTFANAQHYSSTLHYLKAVKAAGTDEAQAVAKAMHDMPIEDETGIVAYLREDGRVVREMYSFKVKTPDQSESEWDVMEIIATLPGDQAAPPLEESGCAYE